MKDNCFTRRSLMKTVLASATVAAVGQSEVNSILQSDKGSAVDSNKSEKNSVSGLTEAGNDKIIIPSWYYEQFDADFEQPVPELGFKGWKKVELEYSRKHTALVSMHTWDTGNIKQYPGWWRCAPYMVRAKKILKEVYPPLLKTVRDSGMRLFHVAGGSNDYWKKYPGYKFTRSICKNDPRQYEQVASDECSTKLMEFKEKNSMGAHNSSDAKKGFKNMDFSAEAKPLDAEPIAENANQLFELCKQYSINHLVYCGFAINWCLQDSPAGMVDMARHGIICSTIREATTAVESKESAETEMAKEIELWRIGLGLGFVFDLKDFLAALKP